MSTQYVHTIEPGDVHALDLLHRYVDEMSLVLTGAGATMVMTLETFERFRAELGRLEHADNMRIHRDRQWAKLRRRQARKQNRR